MLWMVATQPVGTTAIASGYGIRCLGETGAGRGKRLETELRFGSLELCSGMPDSASQLTSGTRKLLEQFRRQRAAADRSLDALDTTATELARTLLAAGLTQRAAAELMSSQDFPLSHPEVVRAARGGRSRRPWRGHRRQGGSRG
jgi:hypothetical protein